jgi:hypothetical protein
MRGFTFERDSTIRFFPANRKMRAPHLRDAGALLAEAGCLFKRVRHL